jgi:hypothetical protein
VLNGFAQQVSLLLTILLSVAVVAVDTLQLGVVVLGDIEQELDSL